MNQLAPRKKRSEKLTKSEHNAFKKWVASYDTKLDALEAFGFSRPTLNATLLKGSGKPETINKIKSLINPQPI